MLGPIIAIIVSVGLGVLLALIPSGQHRDLLGLVRTFAISAALAVVVVHLVPHSVESAGLLAVGVMAAAVVLVPLFERLVTRMGSSGSEPRSGAGVRLEATYFALLVHRVGDGAAMAAADEGGPAVLLALGAHAVPVVAFIVLAFASRGRGHAVGRAAGMAAASVVGAALVESLPIMEGGLLGGIIDAVVAGTLLHVVAHEIAVDPPRCPRWRVADLGAAGAGLATCALPAIVQSGHDQATLARLSVAALELLAHMAPMLLLGLVGAALIQSAGSRFPSAWVARRSAPVDAARGTFVGAPLPLCSCSVIPIARALSSRGASAGLIVAFLIATPESGLETLTLSAQLFGWPFSLARLGAALLIAFLAGLVAAAVAEATLPVAGGASRLDALAHHEPGGGAFWKRFLDNLDELMIHLGVWLLLGAVVAAYVEVLVAPDAMQALPGWLEQFTIISVLSVPTYVCASSATPVAAAVVAKGLTPGAALVGLLLGPATNVATIALLKRLTGLRATLAVLATVIAASWAAGLLVNWGVPIRGGAAHVGDHSWNIVTVLALGALGYLCLRALLSVGFRGWLQNAFAPHAHDHGHVHGHCHDHAHQHDRDQADPHSHVHARHGELESGGA